MVRMGDVWDRAVEFLGDHLSLLLPLVILGLFVPTSISGSLEELRATAGPGLKLGLAILTIAFSILSMWVQLAITALALDPTVGKRMTTIATGRLLPAIGVFLVLGAVFLLLCLPIGILLALGGFDFAAAQTGAMPVVAPGYGMIAVLYMLMLGIALVFFAARLMPISAVIVAERRGVGAITQAFRLTRGLTWRLVSVIILYAVVALVAILAVQTVFGSILRIVAGGDGAISIAGIITAIAVAAVSTAFTTLAAAFAAKLYVAVVRTTEPAHPLADEGVTTGL